MAKKDEVVECPCGSIEVLPNDRVPMHKSARTGRTCRYSGVPADNWDPVAACPGCGKTDKIGAGQTTDDKMVMVCRACGRVGTFQDFIRFEKLQHQKPLQLEKPPERKHRYGA